MSHTVTAWRNKELILYLDALVFLPVHYIHLLSHGHTKVAFTIRFNSKNSHEVGTFSTMLLVYR